MLIIPEALDLAKLQRTSMTEEQIINSYEKDYQDTSGSIEGHMIGNVLDIGCGIAGWQCFLQHYENPEIFLIDKTEVDPNLYYGYQNKTSFYNSMEIAKKNLIANGIDKKNIHIQEATEKNEILFEEKFDLIVSFISCGFHYPIETYLDQIYEKLEDGGVLIVDVRKGTEGLAKLKLKFGNSKPIKEESKYWRVKYIK